MGKLDGKVAFITGAARGQGRSHAVRLAAEGANIIATDICWQIDTVPCPMSTPDDLAETAKQVEALDRRIAAIPHLTAGDNGGSIIITSSVAGLKGGPNFAHYVAAKHGLVGLMRTLALELAAQNIRVNSINPGNVNADIVHNEILYRLFLPDVRDSAALKAALDDGVAQLGKLDIVCANAGIYQTRPALELDDAGWQETIDINLTGVWNTVKVSLPHLVANKGGSMILTSSVAGLKGFANSVHYNAAKHGVVGIMRTIGNEFGQHSIRVNTVHPNGVNTPMGNGLTGMFTLMQSKYVTGLEFTIDAGCTIR